MSNEIPEAAIEAATAKFPIAYWNVDRGKFSVFTYKQVRAFTLEMFNDAFPHLHRAWLEGLIAKAEAETRPHPLSGAMIADWLRAELEENK